MKIFVITILVIICLVYLFDFSVFFMDKDTEKLFYDGDAPEKYDDDPIEMEESTDSNDGESNEVENSIDGNTSSIVHKTVSDDYQGDFLSDDVMLENIDLSEIDLDSVADSLIRNTERECDDD